MDVGGEGSRFVCKLCSKKFLSGKSLGGHMRSHVVPNNACKKGVDEFGQSGYVLRENPKKTWRACGDRKMERVCKQCGKGFQSLKALCGHMACHSDRGLGNPRMVLDSHSDTGDEERGCKKVGGDCVLNGGNNECSSASEVDGPEDVEVAKCLMLLSMDHGSKGGGESLVDSSDNNSVVLETKSSSVEMRIGGRGCSDGSHSRDDMKKTEDSDSGYFLGECGKTESDVSFDAFKECKKMVASVEPGTKSRKRKHSSENRDGGSLYGSVEKSAYRCFNGRKASKVYCRSNELYESGHESSENSLDESTDCRAAGKVVENNRGSGKNAEKKLKLNKNEGHACPFCNKVFKNGQALGGHKRSHLVVDNNPRPIVKPELPTLLFDLNLPAPEANDDDL